MINILHYQLYLVTPFFVGDRRYVLLENHHSSLKIQLCDRVNLNANSPVLAIVDIEDLSDHKVVTDLIIIAEHMNTTKIREWLFMTDANVKGYVVEVILLIQKINNNFLMQQVYDAILNKLSKYRTVIDLEAFYLLILATGEYVHQEHYHYMAPKDDFGEVLANSILMQVEMS